MKLQHLLWVAVIISQSFGQEIPFLPNGELISSSFDTATFAEQSKPVDALDLERAIQEKIRIAEEIRRLADEQARKDEELRILQEARAMKAEEERIAAERKRKQDAYAALINERRLNAETKRIAQEAKRTQDRALAKKRRINEARARIAERRRRLQEEEDLLHIEEQSESDAMIMDNNQEMQQSNTRGVPIQESETTSDRDERIRTIGRGRNKNGRDEGNIRNKSQQKSAEESTEEENTGDNYSKQRSDIQRVSKPKPKNSGRVKEKQSRNSKQSTSRGR